MIGRQGRTGSVIEIQALRALALARLVRASGLAHAEPPGRAAAAPPGLVEPLTDRETAVLRLIAAGKSNQRIARELVVTLDTVKKHVSHILGKLGAPTAPRRSPGHGT